MTREVKLERALAVLITTPHILLYLTTNDPKALEQAFEAIRTKKDTELYFTSCQACFHTEQQELADDGIAACSRCKSSNVWIDRSCSECGQGPDGAQAYEHKSSCSLWTDHSDQP